MRTGEARVVEPELLDELAKENPRAIHSRRDLQRINFFMGNVTLAEGNLRNLFPENAPKRIVELGAGDGTFALALARRFSSEWKNVNVILVDRQDLVSNQTREKLLESGWIPEAVSANVFEWLPDCGPADCIFANLFLHHFDGEKLSRLFRLASTRTERFFACEPRRSRSGIFGTKLLWLIGCNDVTRHDALASVRAGFSENELSALWPDAENWRIMEKEQGLFSHSFVAERK